MQGRSNLPPEKVPWDALKALLRMSIYGGRIDNDFDQRLMDSFIDKVSWCECDACQQLRFSSAFWA